MKTKIFIYIIGALLLCLFSHLVDAANSNHNWEGWRGLEKEGCCNLLQAPLEWSDSTNVSWKTKITGTGHSSPVVSGNNIIVTSAFHTPKNKIFDDILSWLITGLAFFIILLYAKFIHSQINKISYFQLFFICSFSIILGFFLYFSLTGSLFQISENSDHITQSKRWYFSGMILSVGIMLVSITIRYSVKTQILLTVSSLFLSVFIYFFRPAPDYYSFANDGLMLKYIEKAVWIPICVSIVIVVSLFLNQKKILKKNISTKVNLFTKIFFYIAISGLFLIGLYGIGLHRFLLFSLREHNFSFPNLDIYYRDNTVFTNFVLTSLVLWAFIYILNKYFQFIMKIRWITLAVIIMAFLMFVKKNYFVIENEFVRSVICIDIHSGKVKWQNEYFKGNQSNLHHDNSPATPTSIIINDRVYAYFGSPGLVCTDTSGNTIWENTHLPFEDIHGIGSSLMYANGLILILNDMPKAPYITAIDSKIGKTKWKTNRKTWEGFHGVHRTPTIKKIFDKDVIITWGFHGINIYDLNTGKELCFYPLENSIGQLVASIVTKGDTLFVPDRNKFHCLSLNKLLQGHDPLIWVSDMKGKGPVCSSPVYFNNLLFMISDNGFVTCLDAGNGNLIWREKINGLFLSSCTLIGQNLYFSNTSGVTTVIAAEQKFRIVATNNLKEPIYASLAPVENKIIIRTTENVYCINKRE